MLVYRLCKEDEVWEILKSKKFMKVGKSFKINNRNNTHKYMENRKYLHFFHEKVNIFHFDVCTEYYICTYNIPYELLEKYKGFGYYLDCFNLKTFVQVVEYAVPTNDMSFDYLLKIDEIKDDMDIDDYMYNNIKNKLITIYEKQETTNNKKGRLVLIPRKKKDC